MKIYLLNMPFYEQEYTEFSKKWQYIEDEYIGIGIVEAILKENACQVTKNQSKNISNMIDEVLSLNVDCVMISAMQNSANKTYEFVQGLRAKGFSGIIFIGGWFAKLSWEEIFDNGWPVDYVCYVDAEGTLEAWLKNPNQEIEGIANPSNYLQLKKQKCPQKKLDWENDYTFSVREPGRNTYSIESSRGCPHSSCTFCSLSKGNVQKMKWNGRAVEQIKGEILHLYNEYHATHFSFSDDDMLGPIDGALGRAKELHDTFVSLPFKIKFSTSISVRAATNGEILDYLIDGGMQQLCVGFESADEEQLKRYNKQQTIEDNFVAAEKIFEKRIKMVPGLITFDPYATVDTIKKNLSFLFDVLKHYDLGKLTKKLYVITGTPMVKMLKKDGLLSGNYLGYDYKFLHPETETLLRKFEKYTSMVQNVQRTANLKGMQYNSEIGERHVAVAKKILSEEPWEQFASERIKEMEKFI